MLQIILLAIRSKQSQFDTDKDNTTNSTNNVEDPMLPCEFCDGLVPMRKLLEHQVFYIIVLDRL